MSNNIHLEQAKKNKNDEYYTQYEDIENELSLYQDELQNKVIYCNCDDYSKSNFYKYFFENFEKLKLKKLICTHYKDQQSCLFDGEVDKPYKLIYDGELAEVEQLKDDGCFSSNECIELLKEADIVITNPPFSMARLFLELLMKYEKKFLFIGHINMLGTNIFFNYYMKNKLFIGRHHRLSFTTPSDEKVDIGNTIWITNIKDVEKEKIVFKQDYEKFNDFVDLRQMLNCPTLQDISLTTTNIMAVPFTILLKDTKDFVVLGASLGETICYKGKELFKRVYIVNKKGDKK